MSSKNNFYYTLKARHPEVTGSCFTLSIHFPNNNTWDAIIDCGTAQEDEYMYLNDASTLPNTNSIDAIFYTHSHADHIGLAPTLYKNGFRKNGYCSRNSKEAINLSWGNGAEIYNRDYLAELRHNKKATKPLYDVDDVEMASEFLRSVEYNQTFELETGNKNSTIKVTFLDNGHSIGASCILFEAFYKSKKPLNILFTGDYKSHNKFKEVLPIPKDKLHLENLTIVQESTYGAGSAPIDEKTLVDYVIEATNNHKTVFISCIAQERLQEVLYSLKLAQDSNRLSTLIPISVDTKLGIEYTHKVYKKLSKIDFMPKNVNFVKDIETRKVVMDSPITRIVLASSGMGDFGNSPHYLNKFLPDASKVIIFSSFLPINTIGRKILELPRAKKDPSKSKKIRIPGYPDCVVKAALVVQCNEFSSHEKVPGLLDFLRQFTNVSNVIVNHGNIESKETYAKLVEDELGLNVKIADDTCYFKINNEGECRTIKVKPPVDDKIVCNEDNTRYKKSKVATNIPPILRGPSNIPLFLNYK